MIGRVRIDRGNDFTRVGIRGQERISGDPRKALSRDGCVVQENDRWPRILARQPLKVRPNGSPQIGEVYDEHLAGHLALWWPLGSHQKPPIEAALQAGY